MVFQNYALYPHMSVAGEHRGPARPAPASPKAQTKSRVRRTAESLGITEHLHRKPKALSGGQRQRVAMGRRSSASRRRS